jgi:threonine synthase
MADYKLVCADCGYSEPEGGYTIGCPKCGGFIEVILPEGADSSLDESQSSIFRFHRLMPYDACGPGGTLTENIPTTPVVRAPRLSEMLDVEVFYKDEMVMPSGTWKDREGFVSINRLVRNKIDDLFVFSSGNTGTSLARSASMIRGPRLHLVVPKASERRVRTYPEFFQPDYVKLYFFDGSNDECIVYARELARKLGIQEEGGFANYARREGLKLLGLELILDWKEHYDWYVQPVAGGIGVYSLHKAYRDLGMADKCPRMLGVQAEICAPMVNAWRADAATLEDRFVPSSVVPSDFVRVLRTRRPADSYPILKRIMDQVNGRFEDVSDAAIYEAMRLFYLDDYYRETYRLNGRLVGLEPATALAGLVKGVRSGYIERGARVVLNVSGAAKEGDIKAEWVQDLL